MNERCGIPSVTESLFKVSFVFRKFSLTELVLKRRNGSPLIKPFFVLNGWQDEKCVYWKVPVGFKFVCESRILRVERRGPWIPLYREKQCVRMTFHKKIDRRVERVSEVNKNGNFLHWNVPHRKYVINKPLPNKGFLWATQQSIFHVPHEHNGESDHHFSSDSNAVSLYEVQLSH